MERENRLERGRVGGGAGKIYINCCVTEYVVATL